MSRINLNKILPKVKKILFFLYILIFYIFGEDPEKIRYSEILLMIFLTLEFLRIVKTKKIKYTIPIIVIFIFALYCLLSSFWAINSELAISRSKTLFVLAMFLLLTYNFFVDSENSEDILLKIIMWSGIIFSIYMISYYGIGDYFTKLINGERIGEEINNVNTIGMQTSISFIIIVFYALYNKNKKYLIFSILPLIVSLGTGSRKVIILIVLGTILLFILKKDNNVNMLKMAKKIILFIIIMFVFINIVQMPIFSSVFGRFEKMISSVTQENRVDNSTRLRLLFIESGLKQFSETPFLGIGIGNSGYITLAATGWETYLHNNFVELLATVGILGFALYYFTYFYIIGNCLKLLKNRDKYKYINIVLVIFITNIILEYGMVSYYSKNTYIYILLGLIAVEKVRKEKSDE